MTLAERGKGEAPVSNQLTEEIRKMEKRSEHPVFDEEMGRAGKGQMLHHFPVCRLVL